MKRGSGTHVEITAASSASSQDAKQLRATRDGAAPDSRSRRAATRARSRRRHRCTAGGFREQSLECAAALRATIRSRHCSIAVKPAAASTRWRSRALADMAARIDDTSILRMSLPMYCFCRASPPCAVMRRASNTASRRFSGNGSASNSLDRQLDRAPRRGFAAHRSGACVRSCLDNSSVIVQSAASWPADRLHVLDRAARIYRSCPMSRRSRAVHPQPYAGGSRVARCT